jgi:ribulose 1,5-bisphosphate synthetase/thiazole synthase
VFQASELCVPRRQPVSHVVRVTDPLLTYDVVVAGAGPTGFTLAIEGQFAAGEVVGGFHGAAYLSGTGMGKAGVLGRAAGLELVAG